MWQFLCVPPQQRSVCVCARARDPSQVLRGFSVCVCVCGIHLEQGRVLVLLYPLPLPRQAAS